ACALQYRVTWRRRCRAAPGREENDILQASAFGGAFRMGIISKSSGMGPESTCETSF
ncbi:hypothetical protein JYU34_013901, partial [Plutella xylostella]